MSSLVRVYPCSRHQYDGFGRLRETYHYDDTSEGIVKRILDLYDYRYYNEEQTEEY